MTFDSTELDETKIDMMRLALSGLRRIDIINMKKDLGQKATRYQKTFNRLFDLTSMNSDCKTHDMLQYQYFMECKDGFDDDSITAYLNKLRGEIEITTDKNEKWQKKHVAMLLERFITILI